MHKVVVERPRFLSRYNFNKGNSRKQQRLARNDFEDAPLMENLLQSHPVGYRRQFNEHLRPLRRYLLKCAREHRTWNDVYSEMSRAVPITSKVTKHVWTHVNDMVVRELQMIDGVACDMRGDPLSAGTFYDVVWVDPESDVLHEVPARKWNWGERKLTYEQRKLSEEERLVRVNGVWFRVRFERIVSDRHFLRWDVILKMVVGYRYTWWDEQLTRENLSHVRDAWGEEVVAISKKQLNSKEIRQLGLRD